MRRAVRSSVFRRDVRRAQKRGKDTSKLRQVISLLLAGERLPEQYRDHPLRGNWKGYRDAHLEPDWLLIYRIVVHAFDAGASAEEIVASYPTLELGDVYATIAFIPKHRAEVEAYMAKSDAEADRVHREWQRRYPTHKLRRRLRERAAQA